MYIRKIILENWKVYRQVTFEFPVPTAEQNIVLVGAPNGFGKTSLFQGILLGTYGKEGIGLMNRSQLSIDSGEPKSYSNFLNSSLCKNSGNRIKSCSVKIVLVDDKNSPVEIHRTWYFSSSNVHRPQDDSVHIFEGANRIPIGPPPQNENKDAWYREYISRELLPANLSSFFWFDGEKASIFADHDMAEQVKMGITGLLGIPAIKELADDLRKYASIRRKDAPDISDNKIDELEKSSEELKRRQEAIDHWLSQAEPKLTGCKSERDNIQHEIVSFGPGSQMEMRQQIEQIHQVENKKEEQEGQLENLLADDMALALAGAGLRKNLAARLEHESIRDRWETGKQQGDSRLDKFLGSLDNGMVEIEPHIGAAQRADILKIARIAWEKLWFPPPDNCAKDYLHPHLRESDRGQVRQRLQQLGEVNAPSITSLLDSIENNGVNLKQLLADYVRSETVAPHVKEKHARLGVLNSKISDLDQEVSTKKRENESLEGQIKKQNEDLGRLYAARKKAQPISIKIDHAMKVAEMVDKIVSAAVPSQITAIAKAMTDAYKDIAHKGVVEKIDIDDQCGVKLLDKDGNDARDLDASAGEKQIFTQALISAVSSVWGRAFPTIIDTPLGRLDVKHRLGVLKHLAKSHRQVILLSTNTEVVGDYLRGISPSVHKKYLIKHDADSGISTVKDGYFDHEE